MNNQQNCTEHKQKYQFICKSPQCQGFKVLCSQCHNDHSQSHKKYIIKLEEGKDLYKKVMKNLRLNVRDLKIKISKKIQNTQKKLPAFQVFNNKLQQIIKIINQRFEHYRERLKNQFINELIKKFQELYQDLDEIQIDPFTDKYISLQKLSKVFKNDIQYEIAYTNSYLQQLQLSKTNLQSWRIEDDKVLRLITNFQNNLKELFVEVNQTRWINKESELHIFKNMKLYKNEGDKITKSEFIAPQIKESTDLRSKSKQSEKIEKQLVIESMKTDFFKQEKRQAFSFKDIEASICYKKEFYLFGVGNDNKQIYVLDQKTKNLREIGCELVTPRKNMTLVNLLNEIYIIGGQNQAQGCLKKCQKFNVQQKKIYLINSLNCRSTRHSCINYKDKYIFKFGGVSKYTSNSIQLCPNLIQVYHKDIDEWKRIEIMTDFKFDKEFSYHSGILRMKENQFMIFGGLDQNKQLNQLAYNVIVKYENSEIREIRVSKAKKYMRTGIYFNHMYYDNDYQYFFKLNKKGEITLEKYNIIKGAWMLQISDN